jgi:site-specific recombinase XerD
MDLADWNPEERCLTVGSGKGDKDRTTYLDEGAMAALTD